MNESTAVTTEQELEDMRIAYEKEQCATAASEAFNAMFDRPMGRLAELSVRL